MWQEGLASRQPCWQAACISHKHFDWQKELGLLKGKSWRDSSRAATSASKPLHLFLFRQLLSLCVLAGASGTLHSLTSVPLCCKQQWHSQGRAQPCSACREWLAGSAAAGGVQAPSGSGDLRTLRAPAGVAFLLWRPQGHAFRLQQVQQAKNCNRSSGFGTALFLLAFAVLAGVTRFVSNPPCSSRQSGLEERFSDAALPKTGSCDITMRL